MEITTTTTYILELNEKEASWLKSTMQNPIHCYSPDEEGVENREMRKRFWDYLNEVLL